MGDDEGSGIKERNWLELEIDEEEEPSQLTASRREPRPRLPPPPPVAEEDSDEIVELEEEAKIDVSSWAGSTEGDIDVDELIKSLMERSSRPRLSPPLDLGTGSAAIAPVAGGGDVLADEATTSFDANAPTASPSSGDGAPAAEEEEEFSFPMLGESSVVDTSRALEQLAGAEDAWKAAARDEFLAATMSIPGGPRTEEIRKELLANRKVVDVVGLDAWLRRKEAVGELAWFAEWCSDKQRPVPSLDLFESAYRALDCARAPQLRRDADWRRRWIGSAPVPEFFVCPVSKEVMKSPVVVTSGKTVDRSALEKWWGEHGRICPVTGEVLMHNVFIPNTLVAQCVSLWRAANDVGELTGDVEEPTISSQEKDQFDKAIQLADKNVYNSVLHLRVLVNRRQTVYERQSTYAHLLGSSPGAITKLVCLLPDTCYDPNPELDAIVLDIVDKAAAYGPNKEIIGDDRFAVPVLVARTLVGHVDTRVNCAKILGRLAEDYCNKIKIGDLGGLAALVPLLRVGSETDKAMAARAIASICEARENWSRFVKEDVPEAAVTAMRKDGLAREAFHMMLPAKSFNQALEEMETLPDDDMANAATESLSEAFLRWRSEWCGNLPEPAALSKVVAMAASSEEAEESVRLIVSWLQKRCYFPRTYKYRG